MTKEYECLFILRSDLADEVIEQEVKTAKEYIEADGGSVTDESVWGKKRLAYPIRKQRYGYFMLFRFSGNGDSIKTIERKFLLNENVLKAMVLAVDSSIAGKPLPGGADGDDQYRRPANRENGAQYRKPTKNDDDSKPVTKPTADVQPE